MDKSSRRDWRAICAEVLNETDHQRLDTLLRELLEALEDRERMLQKASVMPSGA